MDSAESLGIRAAPYDRGPTIWVLLRLDDTVFRAKAVPASITALVQAAVVKAKGG